MAENDEELMEMFCDGENPEYCYDSQSNTFNMGILISLFYVDKALEIWYNKNIPSLW